MFYKPAVEITGCVYLSFTDSIPLIEAERG